MNLYQTDEQISDLIQFVSFSVGQENYGVHIDKVQEIIRMTNITHLPQTADYVKGIINLRGNIIPIIDMRKRFNMEELDYSELTRVIVVDMGEKLVGIVVDSVAQVLKLPEKDIEDPPDILHGLAKEYIEGIGKDKVNNSMIIILRVEKVLTAEEINVISDAAEKTNTKKKKSIKAEKEVEAGKEEKSEKVEIN